MQITFNTKRLYTEEGQVVTARVDEKGRVEFYDHSRFIVGEFEITNETIAKLVREDGVKLARHVMTRYDRNDYRCICPPRGLTRGEVVIDHRC